MTDIAIWLDSMRLKKGWGGYAAEAWSVPEAVPLICNTLRILFPAIAYVMAAPKAMNTAYMMGKTLNANLSPFHLLD
jgi:hypothetical protein